MLHPLLVLKEVRTSNGKKGRENDLASNYSLCCEKNKDLTHAQSACGDRNSTKGGIFLQAYEKIPYPGF
jgi:hypothetical protein